MKEFVIPNYLETGDGMVFESKMCVMLSCFFRTAEQSYAKIMQRRGCEESRVFSSTALCHSAVEMGVTTRTRTVVKLPPSECFFQEIPP